MPQPKRPLLPVEDRRRLATMAGHADLNTADHNLNRAYAQGVIDALS